VKFDIQPYIGALPIVFGMQRAEVHQLLGRPESSFPIWDGSGVSDHYSEVKCSLGYDKTGTVNHVGFSPGLVELTIQGQPIWTQQEQSDPNPILLTLDPEPMEFVGFWFFLRIGVTTSGYHDDDPNQWAITVFPQGSKSELMAQAEPADTSTYRTRRKKGYGRF
jgi:hypothetical protein